MKKLILLALISATITAQAQIYRDRIGFDLESISHIDIGWMEIRKHTTAPKGKQLGDRIYSANQIGNCQKFVEWMQQSYLPRGCLGNATYYQNHIPKFSGTNSRLGNAINMHAQALPLMYGAQTKIHMFLKKGAGGKFVPQTNHGDYWQIEVNGLQNITEPVPFISSTREYYFVLPDFRNNSNGYDASDKARSNLLGFNNHPNIKDYKHFFLPGQSVLDQYVVVMTKDKEELPFEKITIGEFFTEVEKHFPVWQKIDPVPADRYLVAQKNLARLKEKYKSKWNETAEIQIGKADMRLIDFVNATEGYDDMFDNKDIYGKEVVHTTFPILKVKKTTVALCKTDQPQWLVIRWTLGMATQPYFIHLHESILNNFNFDYVYNYFFNPEKVKGQTYKPLRSPLYKEAVVITNASETNKKNAADENIYFFEDFSTTEPGKKPMGWQTKLAPDGTSSVVKNVDGLEGKWVVMGNSYSLSPNQLKKPLPQNFTLSFELVATQNFTWGSNGLAFQLSKETIPGNAESYLKLKLRPGFDGRDGEAEFETKFTSPPGYLTGTKWYAATGFSNNKKNNRITVTIKKKEETLQVFIDKNKIVEYEKAIPGALLFNAMSFSNGSLGENDRYYISNIKIIKE